MAIVNDVNGYVSLPEGIPRVMPLSSVKGCSTFYYMGFLGILFSSFLHCRAQPKGGRYGAPGQLPGDAWPMSL